MKKNILTATVCLIVTAALLFNGISVNVFRSSSKCVIIDAGHGYPDGGAVASDGTVESDINLAIAEKIYKHLTDAGINCILTRSDQSSIYTEGGTIHAKKVSDIRNRVKIASDNPDALLISIHMNSYPDPDVHGTQVFYKSGSELSEAVASEIQSAVNIKYQPESDKKIKTISSNIYLFKNIKNDSILIECGFMTNSDDLTRFKTESFQSEIAQTISEAVLYKLTGSEQSGK